MKTSILLKQACSLCLTLCLFASATVAQTKSVVLQALSEELQRSFDALKKKSDTPPYFMSYQVTDSQTTTISAAYGALQTSVSTRTRYLDSSLRVGNYQFDNTRLTRGLGGTPARLPIDDDADAIKSLIWMKTDVDYRNAVEALLRAKNERETSVAEQFPAADFSQEKPQVGSSSVVSINVDITKWEEKVKLYSAVFKKYPLIYGSSVYVTAEANNKYFVNTEGTSLQHGSTQARLSIIGVTKADDGMDLFRFETFEAFTIEGLPDDAKVIASIEKVAKDLMALRKAPVIEPYAGPAILSGRASGVFFHEIFGHRIEGHRQKSEYEGNTFTAKINQAVLPQFFSVADDPTLTKFGNTDLSGYYKFDEEGVPAQRVQLVQNGILKSFLMSRSPIKGFDKSNGHGRAQAGAGPVSRQGNLIVQASKTVSRAELRRLLIAEIRRQRKPFGLLFEDISGGFTNTTRFAPQAFQVNPIMVYRIYPDGRPDELVRGVDLIGTPLTVFSKIVAADDAPEIFNGICGAESGLIPVSAVSPGVLISQIEVQKRPKSKELPPILPPPGMDNSIEVWKEMTK
jgi:predicted Zn-dependent protease